MEEDNKKGKEIINFPFYLKFDIHVDYIMIVVNQRWFKIREWLF